MPHPSTAQDSVEEVESAAEVVVVVVVVDTDVEVRYVDVVVVVVVSGLGKLEKPKFCKNTLGYRPSAASYNSVHQ